MYKDSVRQSTCEGLGGSFKLLWNTYVQIDGTMSRLIPTTNYMLLTGVSDCVDKKITCCIFIMVHVAMWDLNVLA